MKHTLPTLLRLSLLIVLRYLLPGSVACAQAPAWQAAQLLGSPTGTTLVNATTTDAAGNVFIAGTFTGTVTFGTTVLTSNAGSRDAFVAKWNASTSTYAWAAQMGGSAFDEAQNVAVSGTSVYVVGSFYSTAASFGTLTLASTGQSDVYVAKLVDAGTSASFAWAQRAGSTGTDQAYGLVISGSSVYVAGYVASPATFGAIVVSSSSSRDAFITKLTDAGASASFSWVKVAYGADSNGFALAVSGNSVYMTGYFSGMLSFGGTPITSINNYYDAFVAKFTDTGASASSGWLQQMGGTDFDQGTALVASGTSVYVAGNFSSATATFGSVGLTSAGNFDVYVAKLTDAGPSSSFTWVQRGGGTGYDEAHALLLRGSALYVTGFFFSTAATFGPTTVANVGNNTRDIYVAKLVDAGASGSFTWAQQAGGPGDEYATGLTSAGATVYVAGWSTGGASISFGAFALANPGRDEAGWLAALGDPVLAVHASRELSGAVFYPNPAASTVTVRLPALPGAGPVLLELLDPLGRVVRAQTLAASASGELHELDVRALPRGLYGLRLTAGELTGAYRLVLQ